MASTSSCVNNAANIVGVCSLCYGWLDFYHRQNGRTCGRCRHCGLVQVAFQNLREQEEWTARFRDHGAYHRERVLAGFSSFQERFSHDLKIARIRVLNLKRFASRGRLLDVGCSNGALVLTARRLGFDAVGIEIDPWVVERAREMFSGDHILCSAFETYKPGEAFDVVTLIDTFEHLVGPHRAMERLGRLVCPGGLLVIEMPDADEPGFQEQGADWKHFRPDEHAFMWGHRHVLRLLRAHNFVMVDSILPYPDRRIWYARAE